MLSSSRPASLARLTVAALAVAVVLLPVAPAAAHDGTCNGIQITIFDGSPGDDVIHGTEGDDVIQAFGGNDVIYGGGGNDTICGGGGNDHIFGEAGNDLLIGGWGHDWLAGGDGNDDLRGNAGDDRMYANGGRDIARGGTGSDACGAETRYNCEMIKRWGHDTEEWREFVDEYFGPLGQDLGVENLPDEALVVIECESAGEPFAENPRSSASGLFQFLPGTWDRWNPQTPGWEGESMFHPEANIATAARLVYQSVLEGQDRWWQWSCKP